MRPLAVMTAALALLGAGCVSVELIKKETPPIQEQTAPSAASPQAVSSTDETAPTATSSESVSAPATSTVPEPAPTADVRFVDDVLRLQATVGPNGVDLSWSPMTEGMVQGYKIVRSASDPLPWYPKSGAIAFLVNGTDAAYADHEAQKGTAYWYRICAVMTDAPVACGNVVKVEIP